MAKKSTNKFYVAIDKDDDKRLYIFEAAKFSKTGRPIGSINGELSIDTSYDSNLEQIDNNDFITAEDHWNRDFKWLKKDWNIRDANQEEINWLRACRAAGELVEKPKVTEMFLIY